MKTKIFKPCIALLVLANVVFTACALATTPAIVPTTPATATAVPPTTVPPTASTATLSPTNTSEPTITATPTQPPPAFLSDFLVDPVILQSKPFNESDFANQWRTYNDATGKVAGKDYIITGQNGWMSGLVLNDSLSDNQAISFTYKYSEGSECEFILETGDWQQSNYRRFGINSCTKPTADLTIGKNALGYNNLAGNFTLKPDVPYVVVIAVASGGDFLGLIIDPAQPAHFFRYREKLGDKWAGISWQFTAKAGNPGNQVTVSDFNIYNFSTFKK